MVGIRRKMIVGFAGLAVLLFFSGVISLVELRRLGKETESLINSSAKNMELSRQMLDALQDQSILVVQYNRGFTQNFDSLYNINKIIFEHALERATVTVLDRKEMSKIYEYHNVYEDVIARIRQPETGKFEDSFIDSYRKAYLNLSGAIKDYMLSTQQTMKARASIVGDTAYRAITPGILALGVGIFILLIFLYLIDIYFALPLVKINKSLKGYLATKIPFQVKGEAQDELQELKEGIEDLINQNKANKERIG